MEAVGVVLMMIVVIGFALCVGGIPGYVLAKRRGLRNPIVASLPRWPLDRALRVDRPKRLARDACVRPLRQLVCPPDQPGIECLPVTDARGGGRPSSPSPCSTWSATGRMPSRSPSTSALPHQRPRTRIPQR